MSNTDKLREIAVKWCPWSEKTSFKRNGKDYVPFNQMLSDLTALISEGYVTKEKYMDDLCDEYQRGFEDGMDEARNTDRL